MNIALDANRVGQPGDRQFQLLDFDSGFGIVRCGIPARDGVMKALGARDRDVRRIFLVESGVIGVLGGVAGLALAAVATGLINRIINYFLSQQGVPFIDYFDFSWWLGLSALGFSVAVSLAAGVYPAMRAVRVDLVRALRHE